MTIIIILLLLAFEIAFTVYSTRSKSHEVGKRSALRIVGFISFLLLVATNFIRWSFRWYALAFWLLLFALFGVLALVKRKTTRVKAFKTSAAIKKAILISLSFSIVMIPALIFPQYNDLPVTGSYRVETKSFTYTDNNRIETYSRSGDNRRLTVQYWYPENAEGTFPLIVFSHGSFGIRTSNLSLFRELASHGYVVCSIDHTYQCFFTTDTEGKTTLMSSSYMNEVSNEDAHSNKEQSFQYYWKWMSIRTGDINFVIDRILGEANKAEADKPYCLIKGGRIGVMGHSLGGSAALGVGRNRSDVGAVMALESPYLSDITGVENGQFVWKSQKYPIPVLNIYSDSSWPYLSEWPQYVENAAMLSNNSPDVHNVYIKGAGHLTLTDLALTSPFLTRMLNRKNTTINTEYCLKTLNRIALQFFDYYLKGQGKLELHTTY
ncbi:MAG: alpha/beta hydrolase [Clostridia bacterium]|nr:alpha/beta hydrolase [Clostridia bacterium]